MGLLGLDLHGEVVSSRPLSELRLESAPLPTGSIRPSVSWRRILDPAFLRILSTLGGIIHTDVN